MNRQRLNFFLLVTVAVLGMGAWMAKRHQAAAIAKLPITPVAADAVNKVLIEWPGKPVITLEKQGTEWRLTTPVQTRADRFEAVGATSLASTVAEISVDSADLNLKEIGLAPPDHSVTYNGVRIDFGNTEPLNQRRYVRVNGQVSLIDDPALATLDADYADLVSKELFAGGDVLQQISLPGLSLALNADGSWTAPPGTANATPQALLTLAGDWKHARALYNEAAPDPAPTGDTVQILLKDGQSVRLVVVATAPQLVLYAPALKIRYVLSAEDATRLLKLPSVTATDTAAPATLPKP